MSFLLLPLRAFTCPYSSLDGPEAVNATYLAGAVLDDEEKRFKPLSCVDVKTALMLISRLVARDPRGGAVFEQGRSLRPFLEFLPFFFSPCHCNGKVFFGRIVPLGPTWRGWLKVQRTCSPFRNLFISPTKRFFPVKPIPLITLYESGKLKGSLA